MIPTIVLRIRHFCLFKLYVPIPNDKEKVSMLKAIPIKKMFIISAIKTPHYIVWGFVIFMSYI